MAKNNSLSSIITALAKSMAQAQNDVAEAQSLNMLRFFKRKRRRDPNPELSDKENYLPGIFPRRLKIGLPSHRENATDNDVDYYCVPFINLVPLSSVRIEKASAEFEVGLTNIDEFEPEPQNEPDQNNIKLFANDIQDDPEILAHQPSLQIDIGSGILKKNNGLLANIKVELVHQDTPEGVMRMVNELINTSQGYFYTGTKQGKNDREDDLSKWFYKNKKDVKQ
ncbi:hypothetical protein B4923_06825 [Brenneria roseae subsp. americana]|uniref:DUF2589 domain-containing protein n=1 Tax=Brenneria roseae subsp. americana TaxID=1508507 RepID=A0A2U1TW67_9GAMM|nr:DUF2589 domain-containing protein [Brenneria roseae]PWC13655.1 hypothetical protein B4923_06825 [Brenneria roseae subsp. americana]